MLRVVGLLVALGLVAACGSDAAVGLEPLAARTRVGIPVAVGEHAFYGVSFDPRGPLPVRIASVQPTAMTPGLRVHGVWGLDTTYGGIGGLRASDVARQFHLVPLSEVRLVPGKTHWQLVLEVSAGKPGTYRTVGVEVRWTAGTERGAATYAQGVILEVS